VDVGVRGGGTVFSGSNGDGAREIVRSLGHMVVAGLRRIIDVGRLLAAARAFMLIVTLVAIVFVLSGLACREG